MYETLAPFSVSPHGTYIVGLAGGDVESLEDYRKGGFHPIHLGDRLGASGRYRILHKLGQGGFGTVWLCQDLLEQTYVALKVHVASVTSDSLVDHCLGVLDKTTPGVEFLAIPADHFDVTGPNGTHQCLVLPLLGPPVSPYLWVHLADQSRILKKLYYQATLALHALHHNNICHGDFRPKNILMRLASLAHIPEEQMLSLVGVPRKCQVEMKSDGPLPDSYPQYLVPSAEMEALLKDFMLEKICVVDFGEAYTLSAPPADLGTPMGFLSPEILMQFELNHHSEAESYLDLEVETGVEPEAKPNTGQEAHSRADLVGPACDIWALGCTLFEIRRQEPLFHMIGDPDEALEAMVGFFGKLPEPWWTEWKGRENYVDENGNRRHGNFCRLNDIISATSEVFEGGKPTKSFKIPEDEQGAFEDFIARILKYKPEERPTVDEVALHPWFQQERGGIDQQDTSEAAYLIPKNVEVGGGDRG